MVTATAHGTNFLLLWAGNIPCLPERYSVDHHNENCVGSLKSRTGLHVQGFWDGPMDSPYPRRLESLTICRQHFLLSYLQCPDPAGV